MPDAGPLPVLPPIAQAATPVGGSGGMALYRLLAWTSPAFPIGAYSFSHGLEWAVEAGQVRDRASLIAWLDGVLRLGGGRVDAILFAHGWRAARRGDPAALAELAELAMASAGSTERKLETGHQGAAFMAAIRAAWPAPGLDLFDALGEEPALPLAMAVAAAAHDIALAPALEAYLAALAANLVSAGVRLIPLGQTDGQRSHAALETAVAAMAAAAPSIPLDRLGGAAFASDIAAMKHETQYTRLFRS